MDGDSRGSYYRSGERRVVFPRFAGIFSIHAHCVRTEYVACFHRGSGYAYSRAAGQLRRGSDSGIIHSSHETELCKPAFGSAGARFLSS